MVTHIHGWLLTTHVQYFLTYPTMDTLTYTLHTYYTKKITHHPGKLLKQWSHYHVISFPGDICRAPADDIHTMACGKGDKNR